MDVAGLRKRIDRLRDLVYGIEKEKQAVQSDQDILNWQEYPAYLGSLQKAQQGCWDAKTALESALDRLSGMKARMDGRTNHMQRTGARCCGR
jgi:hypothetical protein